jgi:hypothetical protein
LTFETKSVELYETVAKSIVRKYEAIFRYLARDL